MVLLDIQDFANTHEVSDSEFMDYRIKETIFSRNGNSGLMGYFVGVAIL